MNNKVTKQVNISFVSIIILPFLKHNITKLYEGNAINSDNCDEQDFLDLYKQAMDVLDSRNVVIKAAFFHQKSKSSL